MGPAPGRVIGRAWIVHLPARPHPQLSFAPVRSARGQGQATEAHRAVLARASAKIPCKRLASDIAAGNASSGQVAAKLGAVREGPTGLIGKSVIARVHRQRPSALA